MALILVKEFGGEQHALDFLLNETEEDVYEFLQKTPQYVQDLRTDSQNLASILENGFEASTRMFGCGRCVKSWWRKVPLRKEVSKCHVCKVKYDPIPRNKEWGWGKFLCPMPCGNEFTGHATMGETESVCYKCGTLCPVDHILPPKRRSKKAKSRAPHSCNAGNCYNRDGDDHYNNGTHTSCAPGSHYGSMNSLSGSFVQMSLGDANGVTSPAGAYPGPAPTPVCTHPKSQQGPKKKLRYESTRHHSTGSTVTDVLSQGSLDTATVFSTYTMDRIDEEK
ncbi:repressor of yield of DENV protein homolog [Elysia marginata]|uniref:Repressor of yield of DENV protein homolog n=1 Tax=Elysia marginata TaxID=1093978 RepID=A0AAV4FFP7_9GAST|nr:repressor of yield of DENV protein homolog [Elysia marginata]